ncbi:hypothetical protein [Streptomyces sp. NPDC006368]
MTRIHGRNLNHMPQLHWVYGYPFAVLLMAVVCTRSVRHLQEAGPAVDG